MCTATELLRKQWFANGRENGGRTSVQGRAKRRVTVAESVLGGVNEVGFDEQCCRF